MIDIYFALTLSAALLSRAIWELNRNERIAARLDQTINGRAK